MWPSVASSHCQLNTQAVLVSFDRSDVELVVGWTIVGRMSIDGGDGDVS